MARTAKLKLGDTEAVYDGEQFVSDSASLAAMLNSDLQLYRNAGRGALTDDLNYKPDMFKAMIEAIAEYSGSEVVEIDPQPEQPEGRVY